MNRKEYLLTVLSEECGEVIQACSKSKRFGLDSDARNGISNAEHIINEFADVVAMIEMLQADGYLEIKDLEPLIARKIEKVEYYMTVSKSLGTLNE